jgi:hypothetical protein
MKPLDYKIFAEMPDQHVFVIEGDKAAIHLVHNLVGYFCSTAWIGMGMNGNNPVRLWCTVTPQYDFREVLDYLNAVASVPHPQTAAEIEKARRIAFVSTPHDPHDLTCAIPREWLQDRDVNRAYHEACQKSLEPGLFTVKPIKP